MGPEAPVAPLALQVAPNPMRARVRLTLRLPRPGPVHVEVVDALGRRVATLHDGPMGAGVAEVDVAVAGLAPGAYVVRLTTPFEAAAARLTVEL